MKYPNISRNLSPSDSDIIHLADSVQMPDLGDICESFITQTGKAELIITGLFGVQPTRHLGNKKSSLGKKDRKRTGLT